MGRIRESWKVKFDPPFADRNDPKNIKIKALLTNRYGMFESSTWRDVITGVRLISIPEARRLVSEAKRVGSGISVTKLR